MVERTKTLGRLRLAVDDLAVAFELRPIWIRLGWNDIIFRYRRSALGPFWFTASTAISIVALGLVYSEVFNLPTRELLPHVCVGFILWGFISSIMLDAGDLFTGSASYIKQIRLPYSLYVCRFILGKTIIFAHDLPIYLVLLLYFGIWPGAVALYAIPGFILLVLNGAFVSLILGVISARFRDIPRIVASLVQILFLVTPILWMPQMLGSRSNLAEANPLFHLIEVVRAPLLGAAPSPSTITITLAMTVINFLVALLLFSRYRSRISYWI